MRIDLHPDYNFRWMVLFGGTVCLLMIFVGTNLL